MSKRLNYLSMKDLLAASDYYIIVDRIGPPEEQVGYLITYRSPTNISDIVGRTDYLFGGGRFKAKIKNLIDTIKGGGRVIKEYYFEILGRPRSDTPAELRIIRLILQCQHQSGLIPYHEFDNLSSHEINYVIQNIPKEDWAEILATLPEPTFWSRHLKEYNKVEPNY